MGVRLLLAAAAAVSLAACGDSSTAPSRLDPGGRSADVLTCRSGYHIATLADGTTTCAPDAPAPPATTASTPSLKKP